jgi:hypothetical protein
MPCINLPTRIVDTSITLIDHIIVSRKLLETKIQTGNLYCGMTDHLPNFIIIHSENRTQNKTRPKTRLFGEKNMAKFRNIIEENSWEEFYNTKNVNYAMDIFHQKYNDAYYKSFPLVQVSRKRIKDKKWVTHGLLKCMKHKDRLYKKQLLHPTQQNINEFKKYRNILNACIMESQENYYKELIGNEKQNLYKLWKIFGSVINPSKAKKDNKINYLLYNNKKVTKSKDMAETFNEHFK